MRLLFRIVFSVVVTLALVVGGLLLLPGDKIAGLAADQIKAQTGREVNFGGEVSLSVWPTLGFRAEQVSVSNADWAGPDPMLRAQELSIGLSAADLIRGQIRVQTVSATAPILNLSTRADGTGNWEVSTSGPATAPTAGGGAQAAPAVPLVVEAIRLRQVSLTYAAHGKDPVAFSDMDLDLSWPDPNGAAEVKMTLRPNREVVEILAEIGRFGAFLGGQVASTGATIRAPGTQIRFDGRTSLAGDAAGRLTLASDDAPRLLQSLGLAQGLPDGLGRSVTLGTDLTYTTDGRLALRDLALELGKNRVSGAADIRLQGVPHITAQLQGDALDFTKVAMGSQPGGASAGPTRSGWSRDRIDAGGLGAFNANVDLSVQSLSTPAVRLGPSTMNLTVDRARAVLKLVSVSVFDGLVQGQLVANNRNGLSVGGNLTVTDIETQALLRDLAGYERFSGRGKARLRFLGVGETEDAIMRSLSGEGSLEVGRGRIHGIDLEALMQRGGGNGGTTVFDRLTASFAISGGNLVNEDLLMQLRNFRADGEGRIGLGARDIDYLFTPVALRANSGQGLAIPIRIRGPWADPAILPDLSEVLQGRIDVEAEKIEDQAKEELRRKLEEELDAPVAEDQDVEELLKDRLEDEAKKGLLKLLGVD